MSGELVPAGQLHLSVRNFPAVSPSPLWVGMRPGTGAGASARAPCRTPPPGPPSTPPALQGGRCCPLGAPTLLLMSRGDVREQAAGPMIPAGPGGAHSPLDGASEAWTACFSAQENAAGAASPSHPGPHPLFRKSEQGQEVVGVPGPSWATGPSARSPAGVRRAETGLHGPRGPRGRGGGQGPQEGRPGLDMSTAHHPPPRAPEAHASPDWEAEAAGNARLLGGGFKTHLPQWLQSCR